MMIQSAAVSPASMRPARSSSFHLVWMTITDPPGSMRVRRTACHHSHNFRRMVGLCASASSLIGSSTIAKCAPLPVRPPPTPAANRPPSFEAMSNLFAALLPGWSCRPSWSPHVAIASLIHRPWSSARSEE